MLNEQQFWQIKTSQTGGQYCLFPTMWNRGSAYAIPCTVVVMDAYLFNTSGPCFATSAPCERLFSESSLVLSKTRCSLEDESLRAYIHHKLKIFFIEIMSRIFPPLSIALFKTPKCWFCTEIQLFPWAFFLYVLHFFFFCVFWKVVFLVTCRNIQRVPIELSAPGSRTLLQNRINILEFWIMQKERGGKILLQILIKKILSFRCI